MITKYLSEILDSFSQILLYIIHNPLYVTTIDNFKNKKWNIIFEKN